jgi:molybdopterin molybdotransferase
MGSTDHLREQIAAGDRIIDGVDCHPGHPMLLGRRTDGPWIVGLPGNPYAAFVAIHTLLVPLLAGLTGSPAHQRRRIRMPPSGRDRGTHVVPVRKRGRAWVACPGHSAASLRGAARAQGLAAVEPDDKAMLLHL